MFFYLISLSTKAGTLDPGSSEIAFEAESRMAAARGIFRQWSFQGKIDGEKSSGELRISVCSLDTSNGMRDNHLRGPDFLDCARFPEAVFRIKSVQGVGAASVNGTLTIKGISKSTVCHTNEQNGLIRGQCIIDRRDFGVSYQSALNPISHNVKIVFALRTR